MPPKPLRDGEHTLVKFRQENILERSIWVHVPGWALTPREADEMANALIEHAKYVRNQQEKK
jgi:hypothetical protein